MPYDDNMGANNAGYGNAGGGGGVNIGGGVQAGAGAGAKAGAGQAGQGGKVGGYGGGGGVGIGGGAQAGAGAGAKAGGGGGFGGAGGANAGQANQGGGINAGGKPAGLGAGGNMGYKGNGLGGANKNNQGGKPAQVGGTGNFGLGNKATPAQVKAAEAKGNAMLAKAIQDVFAAQPSMSLFERLAPKAYQDPLPGGPAFLNAIAEKMKAPIGIGGKVVAGAAPGVMNEFHMNMKPAQQQIAGNVAGGVGVKGNVGKGLPGAYGVGQLAKAGAAAGAGAEAEGIMDALNKAIAANGNVVTPFGNQLPKQIGQNESQFAMNNPNVSTFPGRPGVPVGMGGFPAGLPAGLAQKIAGGAVAGAGPGTNGGPMHFPNVVEQQPPQQQPQPSGHVAGHGGIMEILQNLPGDFYNSVVNSTPGEKIGAFLGNMFNQPPGKGFDKNKGATGFGSQAGDNKQLIMALQKFMQQQQMQQTA